MSHSLKSLLFALAGGVLALLVVFLAERLKYGNDEKHSQFHTEYVFSFPNENHSNSQARISTEIVKKRLAATLYKYELSEEPAGKYRLIVKYVGDSETIRKLLTQPGHLTFNEVYPLTDLFKPLTEADSILELANKKEMPTPPALSPTDTVNLPVPEIPADAKVYTKNPLFVMMEIAHMQQDYTPSHLAMVAVRDTQSLMQFLSADSIRSLFPLDLAFAFGSPFDERKIPLYAVRILSNRTTTSLDDRNIITLFISKSYEGPDKAADIHFEFDRKGAVQWEKLTGNNINKPLAIVLDNYVLSAPVVLQPITGGKVTLSRIPAPQSILLEIMVNGGRLNSPATIISEKITPAADGFFKVRSPLAVWLSGLVVFILVFTVHFIFLRPKKNT